jgi:hypothetical protein
MTRFLWASLLCAFASAGCKYDIDKIYEHPVTQEPDGGERTDAGMHETPLPSSLIGLWKDAEFVEPACEKCAKQKCAQVDKDCRMDEHCTSLTRCASSNTDPNTLTECRAREVPWISEQPDKRALGGPYYTCVFRESCDAECKTHTDWSCLGNYGWDTTTADSVNVTFQFVDFNTPDSYAAASDVRVCTLQEDFECKLAEGAKKVTDARGMIALDLPIASSGFFDGYVELTGMGWYPTLARLGWPLARSGLVYMPVVKQVLFDAFLATSTEALNLDRGLLQMRMFGCAGVGMRDVMFEVSPQDETTKIWYAQGGGASFTAQATDDVGSGGAINVKPGKVTIAAYQRTTDGKKGELLARATAPVRAKFLTIVILAPLAQ